jgi:hypothetical protein
MVGTSMELKYITEGKCTKGLYYSDQKNITPLQNTDVGLDRLPSRLMPRRKRPFHVLRWVADGQDDSWKDTLFSAKTDWTSAYPQIFLSTKDLSSCTTGQIDHRRVLHHEPTTSMLDCIMRVPMV